MNAASLPRERRGKSYDLRPLIETLLVKREGDAVQLEMTLSAREAATGRPGEVLRAMDLDPACAHIHPIGRELTQTCAAAAIYVGMRAASLRKSISKLSKRSTTV